MEYRKFCPSDIMLFVFVILWNFLSFNLYGSSDQTRVGFISQNPKFMEFIKEAQSKSYIQTKDVQFLDLSPAQIQTKFESKEIENQLESMAKNVHFLFLDFNQPMKDEYQPLVKKIEELIKDQVLVVAFAGQSPNVNTALPIRSTLFGKIRGLTLIGEIDQRERLLPGSYFGPEMLTAIKPPRNWERVGASSILFISKLANSWFKKSPLDWKIYFNEAKANSKRLWMGLEELF